MAEVTEMREKQQALVAEARAKLDEITDETTEARAQELEQQYDANMGEYDKLEERIARQQKLAEADERINAPDPRRPKGADTEDRGGRGREEIDANEVFTRAMRFGVEVLTVEERHKLAELRTQDTPEMRAQASGVDSSGGYTVPEGFQSEIVKSMQAYGPMLDPGVTREVVTASGNALPWPTMDDTGNKGRLLGENTQVTRTDASFGQKQLDAFTYSSDEIAVSLQLVQDSAFDMGSLVLGVIGERIGRIANEHLTTGTGTSQPNGILTASTLGNTAAATAAIDFDDIIDLTHGVDPAYRNMPSVRFMFHDNILQAIRKLKDSNGNYIWQPADVRSGSPSNILGYPYAVNQDMTGTIATGNKTMLFGAFEKYVVRRVRDLQMIRMNERYADFLQVAFVGFSRLDGELMDTAAVKHLQQA